MKYYVLHILVVCYCEVIRDGNGQDTQECIQVCEGDEVYFSVSVMELQRTCLSQ